MTAYLSTALRFAADTFKWTAQNKRKALVVALAAKQAWEILTPKVGEVLAAIVSALSSIQ